MTTPADDPRCQGPIKVVFQSGRMGLLMVGGIRWGAVEWSNKRAAWCTRMPSVDACGMRLQSTAKLREDAVALAEEMVRDGTLPSPGEAQRRYQERREREREKRAKRPSEIRRKQERAEEDRLFWASYNADQDNRNAQPFFAIFAEAFDLADPDLWKSNSFAMLRPQLLIEVRAAVAELEYQRHRRPAKDIAPRLERARKILALPEDGGAS